MKNCSCDHDIVRDGSGQLHRFLAALDPSYAPIDSRSLKDLLVFARRYAAQIRFYDIPESVIQDPTPENKISWREFFKRDMAVIAASIADTEIPEFKKEFDEVFVKLQTQTTPAIYAALFAPITGMLKKIDKWYSVAIWENPLYHDLKLAIDSELRQQAQKIVAYEDGFKYVDPNADLLIDLDNIENRDVWGLDETIAPDASIYSGGNQQERILNAALFVEDIFYAFYNFLNKLYESADKYLQFALEQYPGHQPHMALFIAFLQLFNIARHQLNGLTERMLDFYYKEVLRLEAKPSVPDKAHIVFELAKDVVEYDIAPGTALKAGPDKSGIEQMYETTEDLVVNQAKVKEIKTIFIEKVSKGTKSEEEWIHRIFARPVANSADGFGEAFVTSDIKWPTFGLGTPSRGNPKNTCEKIEFLKEVSSRKDESKIGFSIASPQLLLKEGKRLIQLKLNESATPLFNKYAKLAKEGKDSLFEFWFTGEKEWIKVTRVIPEAELSEFKKYLALGVFNPFMEDIDSGYYLDKETFSIFIYISPSVQPVVQYDESLHQVFSYYTEWPVMQVLLSPILDIKQKDYQNITATNLALKVKVGSMLPSLETGITPVELFNSAGITVTTDELKELYGMSADGLSDLVIQNESSGVIPVGSPFDPYGPYPVRGKSFYIGSEEIFNKPLGQLAVFIKKTSEENEGRVAFSTQRIFEYDVSILDKRTWKDLSTISGSDFVQVTLKSNILNRPRPASIEGNPTTFPHIHNRKPIEDVTEWKPGIEKGFLRFTNLIQPDSDNNNFLLMSQNLAPLLEIKEITVSYESDLVQLELGIDELHHVYPFGSVETADRNQISLLVSDRINSGKLTLSSLASSSQSPAFAKADFIKNNLIVDAKKLLLPQFTYLWPYKQYSEIAYAGVPELSKMKKKAIYQKTDLLAEKLILSASDWVSNEVGKDNQYSGLEQEEGMLFIGIENAKPLQMVSMLMEFAEGSAADEESDPPEIHWSYLTNNEWRPFKEDSIVSDGTFGLQTTGIIKIEIPGDATNNNSILTNDLYWLCASVTNKSNTIPMLLEIVTQAVLAEFRDNNNDQTHFDDALPASSINELAVAVSQVNSVTQPFASFDGKHKEIGKEFYTRVSERLRHKARAITSWDYEHLVLDRFPSIYKVKCITHTDPNCLCREPESLNGDESNKITDIILRKTKSDVCCGPQIAPGHVLIIPISNLKNRNGIDPLQPKTSRRVLLEIESYLEERTSPFVRVHAKNPVYEEVLTFFRVKFYEGYDKGFYMKKLNEEIIHYLTPWAFDDTVEVQFGQNIYASSIINFIEGRSYVDFITDFLMVVCRNACCDEVIPEKEDSYSTEDILDRIEGCSDMEILWQDEVDFPGDIIARPSSPRSLLISAPKHIIIPYEEPDRLTPCERHKKKQEETSNTKKDSTETEVRKKLQDALIEAPAPKPRISRRTKLKEDAAPASTAVIGKVARKSKRDKNVTAKKSAKKVEVPKEIKIDRKTRKSK